MFFDREERYVLGLCIAGAVLWMLLAFTTGALSETQTRGPAIRADIAASTLTVGLGPAITKFDSTTSAQDYAAISASSCTDSSAITMTGAVAGDTVLVTPPVAFATTACGAVSACLATSGYVSATNAVKVRVCNVSINASSNPASATFRVDVIRH